MRLTKKKALDISIELWEWMTEDGNENKSDWPEWKKYGEMVHDCPLCAYVGKKGRWTHRCKKCPLKWGRFGCQYNRVSQYNNWLRANNPTDRKKYAGLFLEQLKEKRDEDNG